MKLQEVFDQLIAGELSQISVGGQSQGVINAVNQNAVVNHINMGLAYLFERFTLKEGTLSIPLVPDQTVYTISSTDFSKVLSVKGDSGTEFSLNDHFDLNSVFTTAYNTLFVPLSLMDETQKLYIHYRATHPKFDTSEDGDIDPEFDEVELPYAFLEPLCYFVASRVYHPIGMNQGGQMTIGNTYSAKLEQACQRLEVSNLSIDQGSGNDRFTRNGWV